MTDIEAAGADSELVTEITPSNSYGDDDENVEAAAGADAALMTEIMRTPPRHGVDDDVSAMSTAEGADPTPRGGSGIDALIARLETDGNGRVVMRPEDLRGFIVMAAASGTTEATKAEESSSDDDSSDDESSSSDDESPPKTEVAAVDNLPRRPRYSLAISRKSAPDDESSMSSGESTTSGTRRTPYRHTVAIAHAARRLTEAKSLRSAVPSDDVLRKYLADNSASFAAELEKEGKNARTETAEGNTTTAEETASRPTEPDESGGNPFAALLALRPQSPPARVDITEAKLNEDEVAQRERDAEEEARTRSPAGAVAEIGPPAPAGGAESKAPEDGSESKVIDDEESQGGTEVTIEDVEAQRERDAEKERIFRLMVKTVDLPTINEETQSRENSTTHSEHAESLRFDDSFRSEASAKPLMQTSNAGTAPLTPYSMPLPDDNASIIEAYEELLKRERRTKYLLVAAIAVIIVLAVLLGLSASSDDEVSVVPASSVSEVPVPSSPSPPPSVGIVATTPPTIGSSAKSKLSNAPSPILSSSDSSTDSSSISTPSDSSNAPPSSSPPSSSPSTCSFQISSRREKIDLGLGDPYDPNVALDGRNMAVSVRDNVSSATHTIFYSSDDGGWVPQNSFRENRTRPGSYHPVAVSGRTALVGVHDRGGAGSVSVYERDDVGSWVRAEGQPILRANANVTHYGFGFSVGIDRDLACVLDYYNAFLFRRDSEKWVQFDSLDDVEQPEECAIAGNTVAVRGYDANENGMLRLYEYDRDLDGAVPLQDPIMADVSSMGIGRDRLAYWDLREEDAFVYAREEVNGTFALQQRLNLSISGYNPLALDEDVLVVGGENETHIFLEQNGYWEEIATLDRSYDEYQLSGRNLLAANEREIYSFYVEDCAPVPTRVPSVSTAPTLVAAGGDLGDEQQTLFSVPPTPAPSAVPSRSQAHPSSTPSSSKILPSPSPAPSSSSYPTLRPSSLRTPFSASSPISRPSAAPSVARSTTPPPSPAPASPSPSETCHWIEIEVVYDESPSVVFSPESPREPWWNISTIHTVDGMREKNLVADSSPVDLQVDGEMYSAAYMEYSATNTSINGSLCDCGVGTDRCECQGDVCLIQRGQIFFDEKVANCEHGGGLAAIIYNNRKGDILSPKFGSLGPGANATIPALFISRTDGKYLVQNSLGEAATIRSYAPDHGVPSHTETICLPEGEYEFTIYEPRGDDASPLVEYNITSNGALIVRGGEFEDEETTVFSIPFVPPEVDVDALPWTGPLASEASAPTSIPSPKPIASI